MRFHPMARFFGKPTNGAFIGRTFAGGQSVGGWLYQLPTSIGYSNVPGEGYLIHKGVQPDEEVWLTRDGAAKGEDDVVKRALSWITSLAYSHDVKASKDTLRGAGDTVTVTAIVENPGNHALAVSAVVSNPQGAQVDSLALMNDGLHGDGEAGDSLWGVFVKTPAGDGTYKISVRTDDKTSGSFRRLPDAAWFTISRTGVIALPGILPGQFSLEQNYPNPFNPSTLIRYGLPHKTVVMLTVFDNLGRSVATLVQGKQEAGVYEVKFDAAGLSSGVYFCRINAGKFVQTRKLLMIR